MKTYKKNLADFTPEIQAKIPEYIKRYTEGVFDGKKYENFNLKDAEELIHWNYEKCGFKKPVVIVAENPLEAQYMFNYIVAMKDVWAIPLYIQYCLKNNIELPKELKMAKVPEDSQLDSQLRSQLRSQLGSQLDSQLGSQLRSQLGSQLDKYNTDYLFTTTVYGGYWLGWYKFMKDEFNLDSQIGVTLDSWNDLYVKSGIYSAIFSELVCVVSKYPKEINRNNNNDLHNPNDIAVKWGAICEQTNFDRHFINGRSISKELFDKIFKKEFTITDFINENNEETKSVCIAMMQEKFGDEYLVSFFTEYLKEIDTFVDKKPEKYLKGTTRGMNVGVYTLFKGVINGENIAYIRCFCPSSDRMFFLGVDSKHTKAKNAIASLARFPKKMIPYLKGIMRQGERITSTYQEEGWNIYNSLSEKDISDLDCLPGEQYFNKMSYEF